MKTRENIPPTVWPAWCQAQVGSIASLDWPILSASSICLWRWEIWEPVVSQFSHLYHQTVHVRTDSSLGSGFVSAPWFISCLGRSYLSRKVCRVLIQILVSSDPSRQDCRRGCVCIVSPLALMAVVRQWPWECCWKDVSAKLAGTWYACIVLRRYLHWHPYFLNVDIRSANFCLFFTVRREE